MLNHTRIALMLAAAMVVASSSLAQNVPPNIYTPVEKPKPPEKDPKEEGKPAKPKEPKPAIELPDSFYKIGELMGMRVDAKGGEKIGEIKNLAINTENGRIRYVLVDGGSGKLYPIPMSAMKFPKNRQKASVDTSTDRMKDAPTFNPEGWNTIGNNKWGATVYQFYGIDRTADDDKEAPEFVASSAVVGAKAESRKGDGLGSVKNLMIDTDKRAVAYAVLDFGRDNKLFAVPWQSMTVRDAGKKIVMHHVERDDLKDSPGFPNSRWPSYKELGWKKDTNFDAKPPKWIYGYGESTGDKKKPD